MHVPRAKIYPASEVLFFFIFPFKLFIMCLHGGVHMSAGEGRGQRHQIPQEWAYQQL